MGRLLIVSNRLPVTAAMVDGELRVERSIGGVATALAGIHSEQPSVWVGWAGPTAGLSPAQAGALSAQLAALDCHPVPLTGREVREYYEGVANRVLWPLFHYFTGRFPLEVKHWDTYREVNQRFAEAAAAVWRPGDRIWVQDYHLLLVPGFLRQRLPDAPV